MRLEVLTGALVICLLELVFAISVCGNSEKEKKLPNPKNLLPILRNTYEVAP